MSDTVFKFEGVKKWFPVKRTFKEVLKGEQRFIKAVDGIDLEIKKGEIFGIVGESGCGKSTTGKLLMKIHEPSHGSISFDDENVTHLEGAKLKEYRRKVQMIFQDPYASMNPRFKISDVLTEPLKIHGEGGTIDERETIAKKALEEVRLMPPEEFMGRFPHMLSGGQRQRAATARTLVLSPEVIVADEPVSMVDLSTRAEILYMLKQVQRDLDLTYVYITHDLSTARYFTDRIAVMYLGKIVEIGDSDSVILSPKHPYTKALIAAVCEPIAGKENTIKEIPIKGDVPNASAIPNGCRFHPRCLYATDKCREESPEMADISDTHQAACHYTDKM